MNIINKTFQLDVGGNNFFCPENLFDFLECNMETNVSYFLISKLVGMDGGQAVLGEAVSLTIESFPIDPDFGTQMFADMYSRVNHIRKTIENEDCKGNHSMLVLYLIEDNGNFDIDVCTAILKDNF